MFDYNELFSVASGNYLTEAVPIDFIHWDEDRQYKYIEENVTELFENYNPEQLYQFIDDAAFSFKIYLEGKIND